MNYFFQPEALIKGSELTLTEEEGRHASKVLRSVVADRIHLINGMGQLAEAEIVNIKGAKVDVLIQSVTTEARQRYSLSIGLAILKKRDRLEWFIEKSVELAADKIILFHSQHTEKSKVDLGRLQKIAITALKQSGNLWLPEIAVDQDFKKLIGESFHGSNFIAHCRENEKSLLSKVYKASENALVLIGPEGDFSEPEIKKAIDHGFTPVSLGDLRLRSETAALAALMILQIANQ